MPEEKKISEVVFSWQHKEYIKHEKSVWWYVVSLLFLILLVTWSIMDGRWFGDSNYLFAVFLILFYLVVLLLDHRDSKEIRFVITPDGIMHGNNFYTYDKITNFFIIYEEKGVKNLYFDLNSLFRGRLVIPLDGQNAVEIREYLLQFLNEDLDRKAEPLSEQFRHWLKL